MKSDLTFYSFVISHPKTIFACFLGERRFNSNVFVDNNAVLRELIFITRLNFKPILFSSNFFRQSVWLNN